jgi:hypothetical protein
MMELVPASSSLLPQRLQFRNRFEVPRASRGSLGSNKAVEIQALCCLAKQRHGDSVADQIFVATATGNVTKEIDVGSSIRREAFRLTIRKEVLPVRHADTA